MRRVHRLTIAAALAVIVGSAGTASAQVYEWEYSINGGAYSASMVLPNSTSNSDSVSLFGGDLTISISTSSNNPGATSGAYLFNATTNVDNTTGTPYTVAVQVTETGYTLPTGSGNLSATVQSISVAQVNPLGTAASATFSGMAGYLDGMNAAYGTQYGTAVGSTGVVTGSSPNQTLTSPSNPFTPNKPFSMTVTNTVAVDSNSSSTDKINAVFTPLNIASVPEPSTMVLAGLGAMGLIGFGLRRRKALGA